MSNKKKDAVIEAMEKYTSRMSREEAMKMQATMLKLQQMIEQVVDPKDRGSK